MIDLYHTYKGALGNVRYPMIFLDLNFLEANAKKIARLAGTKSIRIASKSIRSTWVLSHLLQLDEKFQGIMTFSVNESVWLATKGFTNILVGYPTMEPKDFASAEKFLKSHRESEAITSSPITFMVCTHEQLSPLKQLAENTGVQIPVCIDIDQSLSLPGLHFGVRRSPLRRANDVIELAKTIQNAPELKFAGFMGYEAQIAGVPDSDPANWLQNFVIRILKTWSEKNIRALRAKTTEMCRSQFGVSGSRLLFNGGGTGSLAIAANDPSLTEVTAGSGFYAPGLFDHYDGLSLDPALGFGLRIARKPDSKWITCHGGGYVASGAVGKNKLPQPYLPPGLKLSSLEGAGEVQTPITGAIGCLKIGDPVYFRHAKAGELCERFNEIHLIRDGKYLGSVSTYRGDGQAFL